MTRVAVLYGGPGGEYDISCASAARILKNLDSERYDVSVIRVTVDGIWVVGEGADVPELSVRASISAAMEVLEQVDVAIPVFHGIYGEGGTVQALLELNGVPYVGNGVAAGAAGMDKQWTKTLLTSVGLAVADAVVLEGADAVLDDADRDRLGLPAFVKPARAGSSLGVTRLDDWSQLDKALALARESDTKVLVEAGIEGRELEIGVLQQPDGTLLCGPPLEILKPDESVFFDFDAKYQPVGGAVLSCPAELDPEVTARLQEQARLTFRTLGCSGLLRVDFFLRTGPDGEPQPVLNEVNTFPGFTPMSQYPLIWESAGVPLSELLTTLIDTALVTTRSTTIRPPVGKLSS
jgi:D-alanine-D-alanine ligase